MSVIWHDGFRFQHISHITETYFPNQEARDTVIWYNILKRLLSRCALDSLHCVVLRSCNHDSMKVFHQTGNKSHHDKLIPTSHPSDSAHLSPQSPGGGCRGSHWKNLRDETVAPCRFSRLPGCRAETQFENGVSKLGKWILSCGL